MSAASPAWPLYAAIFHLFTHAFFKALLFLGSGSVMHAMGGVIDMRRFGGLRHRLPTTYWTFAVGALALSGIPPLAGFFSKDEILIALKQASHAAGNGGWGGLFFAIYCVAVVTAFMTAFYTGRAFFLTFWGPDKLPSPEDPEALESAAADHAAPHDDHGHTHDAGHGHGHDDHLGRESPPIMYYPLMVLAVCAALVGIVFGPFHLFEHQLEHTLGFEGLAHAAEHATEWVTPVVGTLVGVLGIGLSYWLYGLRSPIPGQLATQLGPLYRASYNKFYIDEFYQKVVILPTMLAANASAVFDMILDALVRGIAWVPRWVGRTGLAPFQNGLVQLYAAVTALGVAGLLFILLVLI